MAARMRVAALNFLTLTRKMACKNKKILRRHDPHTLKGIKRQQICVTCENHVGLSVNSHFEKFVVSRVAASVNRG